MSENYSLREAAEILGLSVKAIRHRMKSRDLRPTVREGPHGALYLLTAEQLEALKCPIERSPNYREGAELGDGTVPEQVPGSPGVPVEVHSQALNLLQQFHEERSISEKRASVAERQLLELQIQVGQYQRALSEHAESLNQIRAEGVSEGFRQQTEQNQLQMSMWEKEKAELLEDLQFQKKRVSWLEERVPRWVRKVFGAG